MAHIKAVSKIKRQQLNPLFHRKKKEEDDCVLSDDLVRQTRKTGQLNLSGYHLYYLPRKLFEIYSLSREDYDTGTDFNKSHDIDDERWWNFRPLTHLDLSCNALVSLPDDISQLDDLIILNLYDNSLTSLSTGIGKLTKLTKLNLSRNKLEILPDELFSLVELQVLNLSWNNMSLIPKLCTNLVMLHSLDISHNNLKKLPAGMGFLVRLRELNISHNMLKKLPADLVSARDLQKLDASKNELRSLPNMSELTKLQFLYAHNNNIEELPSFDGCQNLEELHISDNKIKEIPEKFFECIRKLKVLVLRDNYLEVFPEDIALAKQLTRLDLTNNSLTSLPNGLTQLPHLQNIQLEGNKLKSIRSDVIRAGTSRILKYLRETQARSDQLSDTDTSDQQLLNFPDRYQMKNCQSLNLAMKDIEDDGIPEQVLQDIKELKISDVDLCKNRLTKLPETFELIVEQLCELNLCENRLTAIPDCFGRCIKLKYLNLGFNQLKDLPSSMAVLVNLKELVLSFNRLSAIPTCIYGMAALEILLLNDNQIASLDSDSLSSLKMLSTLDISNNSISVLPPQLGNMMQIKRLRVQGNLFRQPRHAILEQGTDSILSYLRDRIPQ